MKKLFLTFALTAFGYLSFCQDFATVYSGKDALYKNLHWGIQDATIQPCSSDDYIGLAIDSSKINATGTIYYHFNILHQTPETSGCSIYKKLPNWTGSTTLIKNTGENIFLNNEGDSIRINARAALNDKWHFYDFPNGDYFEAMLTDKYKGNVLTTTDSIKTITLTLKDNLGNTLDHLFNDKHLILTKNYGLLQAFDFSRFPKDTSAFILCGISNPDLGVQNLTAKEIFDYSIGDEFHIDEAYSTVPYYGTFRKERRIVLEKNISANEDTLTYKIERILITHNYTWLPNSHDSSMVKDTLTEKITLSEYPSVINNVPIKLSPSANEPYYHVGCLNNSTQYNNRLTKTHDVGGFNSANDPCFDEVLYSPPTTNYYIEGLGAYFEADQGVNQCHKRLLYYKKGTETGGTADPLLAIHSKDKTELNLLVAPNPFSDFTTLTIGNSGKKSYELQILDMHGKVVKEYSFDENQLIIHNDENLKGLYMYKLYSNKNESASGKLMFY